jgi:PAS domain S-box-containing protein
LAKAVRAVLAVVILVALSILVLLGTRIYDSLEELRAEAQDNLHWNLSQMEVDLVRLREEMRTDALSPQSSLIELRKRFDLFYSRAQNAISGKGYSVPGLDDLPQAYSALLSSYLARETPLIDGPDATLRENLGAMADRAEVLRVDLRNVSILMIDALARLGDLKREAFAALLHEMVIASLATLLIVLGLMAVAFWLNSIAAREVRVTREVGERLRATIDNALDAIIVADGEGRIIQYNPSAELTFGWSKAEVMGRPFFSLLLPPELRADHEARLVQLRGPERNRMINSGRILSTAQHKNGARLPVEVAVSTAEGSQGKIFIAFARDISDRVAAEAELTGARDKALAAGRAKTDFIGVMSHEMRTPLNGVLASLEIASGMTTDPELLRFIGLAQNSAQLLLRHANDVLDITRLEGGALEMAAAPFDIHAHLSGLVETVRPMCSEKGISLSYDMPGEHPVVMGDAFRIGQIVQNFLSNAIKFVSEGGITVEAEVSEAQGETRIIEVRVTDTGPGIAEVDQARIFEEFVMLDPSFGRTDEGAGLGLAICRRLATAMGGEIGVESAPGEGSCFWLRLPLRIAARPEAAKASEDRAPMPVMDVLVVEDNATNRAVLGELLKRLGQKVTFAFDGEKGFVAAAAHRFDVILMDVSMPVMDGLTATRLIRREGASHNARIIAVTAHSMPEDLERIRAAGMDEVLTKPISGANLIRVLSGTSPSLSRITETAIDDDRIAELRSAIGAEGLARLAGKFLSDGARQTALLLSDEAADERLGAMCHEVAGMASVLGAERLRRLCIRAEDLSNAGQIADARAMLHRDLGSIWHETVTSVRTLLI